MTPPDANGRGARLDEGRRIRKPHGPWPFHWGNEQGMRRAVRSNEEGATLLPRGGCGLQAL